MDLKPTMADPMKTRSRRFSILNGSNGFEAFGKQLLDTAVSCFSILNGSNGFEAIIRRARYRVVTSFSILNGSNGFEASISVMPSQVAMRFQYPQRIEWI